MPNFLAIFFWDCPALMPMGKVLNSRLVVYIGTAEIWSSSRLKKTQIKGPYQNFNIVSKRKFIAKGTAGGKQTHFQQSQFPLRGWGVYEKWSPVSVLLTALNF